MKGIYSVFYTHYAGRDSKFDAQLGVTSYTRYVWRQRKRQAIWYVYMQCAIMSYECQATGVRVAFHLYHLCLKVNLDDQMKPPLSFLGFSCALVIFYETSIILRSMT